MKYAVIIKHPFRDGDFRVDIVDLPEGTSYGKIKEKVEREMLGPFEVIGITERIDFNRKIEFKPEGIKNISQIGEQC